MSVYTVYTGYTGFVALPYPVIFLCFFFDYLFFILSHLSLGKKGAIVILHKNGFSHQIPPKIGTRDVHAGIIKVAKKFWRAITAECLGNLFESMPRRMVAVRAAGGRHAEY